VTVTIADGAATSEAIYMVPWAGGYVLIANSWTAANLGFQVAEGAAGTYSILRDEAGSPVQISGIKTDGGRAYALPPELFGALYFKAWSKSTTAATETDTNQSGDINLTFVFKS